MRSLAAPLLLINIMLLFLPLGSLLYLDTYEKQLLAAQENSMIQQGRIFSSALKGGDIAGESRRILANLGLRVDSRIRVVDPRGNLVADSATLTDAGTLMDAGGADAPLANSAAVLSGGAGSFEPVSRVSPPAAPGLPGWAWEKPGEPDNGSAAEAPGAGESQEKSETANTHLLYRMAVYPLNLFKKLFLPPPATYSTGEYYSGQTVLLGPEIQAALAGRYGAVTRYSTGGQVSVNLYSAIPILGEAPGEILGAVLVSRSTYGILDNLYRLRLDIIKIFLISLGVSLLLTLGLAVTITIPLKRLQREAERVLDQTGRFQEHFRGLKRKDEIGDLSRSLSTLSQKLEKRISFIDGFTADLLHELKNPLAAIRAAVDMSLASPAKEESLLQGIKQEEQRMERLLARLREISRLDNVMDREARENLDLEELIPLILDRYPHRDFPDVGIDFKNTVSGGALVSANPDRLVQAVTNPVDNALSFSPAGSTVLLTLAPGKSGKKTGWFIYIDDQGPGIADGVQDSVQNAGTSGTGTAPGENPGERYFQRFYSERPQEDREKHSGLGLAIVRSIVAAYGGECSLKNREDRGCRFTLFLPGLPGKY